MRITVACPEALRDDANNLAMVLAFGPPDALTYGAADWLDADGNRYACASFVVRPEWIEAAQSTLHRPEWDVTNHVNIAGAGRAQDALVFSPEPIPADPAKMTVCVGDDALAVLAAMGLERKGLQ